MMKIGIAILMCSSLIGCANPRTGAVVEHPEQSPDPTLEQVAQVKPGMTKQKVVDLLGNHFFMQEGRMCYRTKLDVNFTMSHRITLTNGIVAEVKSVHYMDGPEPMDE
jgi:hypothetical protein